MCLLDKFDFYGLFGLLVFKEVFIIFMEFDYINIVFDVYEWDLGWELRFE